MEISNVKRRFLSILCCVLLIAVIGILHNTWLGSVTGVKVPPAAPVPQYVNDEKVISPQTAAKKEEKQAIATALNPATESQGVGNGRVIVPDQNTLVDVTKEVTVTPLEYRVGDSAVKVIQFKFSSIVELLKSNGEVLGSFLKASCRRDNSGLKVVLSAVSGKHALEIDATLGKVFTFPAPTPPYFYIARDAGLNLQFWDSDYMAYCPGDKPGVLRFKRDKEVLREIPWKEDVTVYASLFYKEYRYGFGYSKNDNSHELDSLLLIDKEKNSLLLTTSFPETSEGLMFPIVEPNVDIIAVFERHVKWILIVDYHSIVDQKSKPVTPPWPHPTR